MPGTYSQLYVQIVFAVAGRESIIDKTWRDELHKYISGIVTAQGQKSIIVNGYRDHVHVFLGLRPSMRISDLVREIKIHSTAFVNDRRLSTGRFSWQEGYGAFSYSRSQVDSVFKYIENQEEHHKRKSFREEYKAFLDKFQIQHDDQYLFNWID